MVPKVEHAHIRVNDLDSAVRFYTDIMGLVEVDSKGDDVRLSCGLSPRYDLAVTEGGSGLDHFAIRTTADQLSQHRNALAENDIEYRDVPEEDGVSDGIRVNLPSGIEMELVSVEADPRYKHISETADEDRKTVTPVSIDHVNLMAQDVQADVEFLVEHVDFELTEVQTENGTGRWGLVFSRYGNQHHDVGYSMTDNAGFNLHHVGWTMASTHHLVDMVDELARNDISLEAGISRHLAGNNVFAYFWTPGGNRFELSTEMVELDEGTEALYREGAFTFTSWGGITPPESFFGGS